MTPEEKKKAFATLKNNLKKKWGEAVLTDHASLNVEFVSSGSPLLDACIGGGIPRGRFVEIYGDESSGKAQPLSEKILTPSGYIRFGDIEIGSLVLAPDGTTTSVVGIYPQGVQDVYKLTFNDGSFAYSTMDHLWTLEKRNGEKFTASLQNIVDSNISNKTYLKYRLPDVAPFPGIQQNLVIDPYLLGCLLGDGSISNSSIKFSSSDESIVNELSEILANIGYFITRLNDSCDYMISRKTYSNDISPTLHSELRKLGLLGTISNNKFIPHDYLNCDIAQRIALFQGLIDTDGHVGSNGTISFTTVSKKLSDDFVHLARSLGMRVVTSNRYTTYKYNNEIKTGQLAYTSFVQLGAFSFTVSRLERKQSRVKHGRSDYSYRYLKSVEFYNQEECQCIMIDHPDHMYITSNFIPTHNTTSCAIIMTQFQKAFPDDMVGFIDVEHAFNVKYSNELGLNTSPDKFAMAQPGSAEEALEILLQFCESGLFSVICLDSVGGLVTKAQLEKGIDEETMGSLARVLSKSASRIAAAANDSNTTVLWINQTRNKIVLMGNPETVAGGKTLPFFHSVRIKVRKTAPIVEKEVSIGQEVEYKIVKNKVGPPFGTVGTSIFFGKGFDEVRETIDVSYKTGPLQSAGAWVYLDKGTPTEQKWNGKAACISYYRDHPDEYAALKARTFAINVVAKDESLTEDDEDGYEEKSN